jgi:hypothetical protein
MMARDITVHAVAARHLRPRRNHHRGSSQGPIKPMYDTVPDPYGHPGTNVLINKPSLRDW